MVDIGTIQDWFIAALLHDLGKTRGWVSHGDWSNTPYAATPELKQIAERAKQHEDKVFPDTPLTEAALLALADKLQKGLYGWSAFERIPDLPPDIQPQAHRLQNTPTFQSYYDLPTAWDKPQLKKYEFEIIEALRKEPTLANMLALQREQLNNYPHTTYIPHVALGLHQQLTAALFFFLWRRVQREKLTTPTQLAGFTIHAFTITPEPLAFFARLRYLNAYRDIAQSLEGHLFRKLFVPLQHEGLSALTPKANPFLFFSGSSFALLYDDDKAVENTLQDYLDSTSLPLDSIGAQIHSYTLTQWGVNDGGFLFADPNAIEREVRALSIIPKRLSHFTARSETRCTVCGCPTSPAELSLRGAKNLCAVCATLERQKGILDLRSFCPDQYLGWVFLSFASPLLDVAMQQAEEINREFGDQHLIPPGLLNPSVTGFDEFFQALTHIEAFENKCDEQIQNLGQGARTLAEFTHLAIYLLCEDNYWKFLGFLNQERRTLRIPTSLRAFLCGPKHPVWSLMQQGAQYDPEQHDLYYHIAEGSVTMFTATDVNTIRNLATAASAERVTSAQLNGLVRVALRATLPELFLEIDVKAREGKLGRQRFAGQLKNGLDALKSGDDFTGRERRAIFIKYIAKLAGEERR